MLYSLEYRLHGEWKSLPPFADRAAMQAERKVIRKLPGVTETRSRKLDRTLTVDLLTRTVWLTHDGAGYAVSVADSGAILLTKEDGTVRELRPGWCSCEGHAFGAHKGVVCRHRADLGAVRSILAPLMAALLGKPSRVPVVSADTTVG